MTKIQGIYGICDNSFTPQLTHAQLAQGLLQGGVKILQLRMKGETRLDEVERAAQSILALKSSHEFVFILNDHVSLGKKLGADGVHVGADDMAVAEAKALVGTDMLVGYSSHSATEAKAAETAGADYVALGAIFPTATKGPGHPVVGLATLSEVVEALQVPVVAIGGINRENFFEVKATGVAAVAMISALVMQPSIQQAAEYFQRAFYER